MAVNDESIKDICEGTKDLSVETKSVKRTDYIDWNEYFMAVSFLSALRSKDPMTQVLK